MKAAVPALLSTLLFLASCQTAPAPIPADATSEVYFQRAQAASDQSNYDEALGIYQDFLTKNPTADTESRFQARYEVALLLAKQGHDPEARKDFEEILADYGNLDKSAGAPGWVKVLSEKKLNEIKDRMAKAKG
jgi:tetratricopeptide (TPR) repeat protein